MIISIKATKTDITPAIETYVIEKIESLARYYPEIMAARVELALTSKHHQKGEGLFRSECNLRAPGRIFRAEATAKTLYAAVDKIRDELKVELRKSKERRVSRTKRVTSHRRS